MSKRIFLPLLAVLGFSGYLGYLCWITPGGAQLDQALNATRIYVQVTPDRKVRIIDVADHLPVPLDRTSEHLRHAVLATEDRRFFNHFGIDGRSLLRGVWRGITRGRLEGGSTLTQQLARSVFLSHERSLNRKLREAILALKLEWRYSKDELLEYYLRSVNFGAYGAEAAARVAFGKTSKNLNALEAAALTAGLTGPSLWSYPVDPGRAVARAHKVVLPNMVEAGYLTSDEARRAVAQRLRKGHRDYHRIEHRAFTDWLSSRIAARTGTTAGPDPVYTTLNPEIQVYAERALRRGLRHARRFGATQGAIVVLSPDGAVRAMVGSADYGKSQFNRATDARRQPGSAFKPFVYLAALKSGLTPTSRVLDAPVRLARWNWAPKNLGDTYRGRLTLSRALAISSNVAAVRLSEQVGRDKVAGVARRFGIGDQLPPDPTLALGTGVVSLIDLTAAYATFANGGYRVEPYGILGIVRKGGRRVYWRDPTSLQRIVSEVHVAAMNRMLRGALADGGTGARARLKNHMAGGKTGTSKRFRDAWFVGYTHHYVVGVWIGNDGGNSPMREGATGGALAAPIWRDVMGQVHKHLHLMSLPLPGVAEPTPLRLASNRG